MCIYIYIYTLILNIIQMIMIIIIITTILSSPRLLPIRAQTCPSPNSQKCTSEGISGNSVDT